MIGGMELLDREACYRAFQTHDARFDGRIFVGVTSTGIYCRPICPARTPKFENCRFFASAAAAQEAGFRPCLRCRPETAPELAFWRGTSNTVSRAHEADRRGRARRERGRRRGAGRAAGRRRPPVAAAVPAASRRLADRRGADAARAVRQAPDPRHAAADDRGRAAGGLRQRAALQRDLPQDVRPAAERAAPQGAAAATLGAATA